MPKTAAEPVLRLIVDVSTDGVSLDARLARDLPGQVASAGQNGADEDEDQDSNGQTGSVLSWATPVGGGKRRRRGRDALGERAKTIAPKRLTREEIHKGQQLSAEDWLARVERPKTRRDCWTAEQAREQMGEDDRKGDGCNSQRPCPFVACRRHPYLDVNPDTGSIKLNFPHLEVWELKVTCALDVAEAGGDTLEGVGEDMNLTRERIRQVEVRGLLNMKAAGVDVSRLEDGLSRADKLRERIKGGK